jgi:hypothetical protein
MGERQGIYSCFSSCQRRLAVIFGCAYLKLVGLLRGVIDEKVENHVSPTYKVHFIPQT